MEIWKDITNFEGLYQVSNLGNIRALNYNGKKGNIKNIKPVDDKGGYLRVCLTKNKKAYSLTIHRLVAIEFIKTDDLKLHINLKDENKHNNCVDNLEWCTQKYNNSYGSRTEKTQKKVVQINKDGKFMKCWDSIINAERQLDIPHANIISCCKKQRKTAGGYMWKYKEG